jgi:hypothetical protein
MDKEKLKRTVMTTFEDRERARQAAEAGREGGQAKGSDRRTLADLVLEAVRHVGADELIPPVTTEPSPAFQPRAMLAMLTYCYANGVYGSWDVEQMMYEDTAFRALCGRDYPDSRRFRRFRRNNHTVLRRTLEETLRGAWSLNLGLANGGNGAPKESSNGLLDAAAQEWIAREAEHRLEKAMFIDHMSTES